ncbi:hypothetical protein Vch1786_I0174 [Vibrio cholerae O1 str. 2010EL-1786]|uniref:Uncharacterized protein n=2 Tax=Vibrio cholerae TaxID=666 RepID=Q9KU55_VIBCH|nr:hypothetical protein VC_0669 [Vibrio cholerae O1 biovar El Tor str. N16961]ACP04950.1 conserved hypothetical protein [Vibrio cholerae M66-2]ACP08704.1 conserved hypothetical protein [Vibrio cholerae O395]AET25789.1 hypothetical protein Vch1786_I0174 [Vibrio cholerae O1 str. 2010EL-1786]EEO15132.1 hypothetical protein VCB_000574 [Vibrio cholerae TMA 21]
MRHTAHLFTFSVNNRVKKLGGCVKKGIYQQ